MAKRSTDPVERCLQAMFNVLQRFGLAGAAFVLKPPSAPDASDGEYLFGANPTGCEVDYLASTFSVAAKRFLEQVAEEARSAKAPSSVRYQRELIRPMDRRDDN